MYAFSILDTQVRLLANYRIEIVEVSEPEGTRAPWSYEENDKEWE